MYKKNEELVHMHQHRIMKNKKFFEDNSFEGSQFFKWTEEFNEMLEALDDLKKNGMGQNYLCHAAEEIADEVITRIQWNMSEKLKENAIKKIKLEKLYELYEFVSSHDLVKNFIKNKVYRTELFIETGIYTQYIKKNEGDITNE